MNRPLERTSPERQGVSSRRLLALLRDLDSIGNEVHGVMVARHDCVIAEGWLAPYGPDIPHSCHSLGKSYTCTAAGLACTQGLMTPDDLLTDIFADEIRQMGIQVKPGMEKVTIRHLMTMSSGTKGMPAFDENWLANFLGSEMEYEPGSKFYYNTTGSCVLGAAVEKVTGMGLLPYMRKYLFPEIGIGDGDVVWQKFANGYYAEPGICTTTEANLRLGLFYLHHGCVNGKQIIDRAWMDQATTKQIETSDHPGTDDGSMGYGWQLWLGRVPGIYRFDGGQGQLSIVDPRSQCVVAIHQAGHDPYGVARCIELVHDFMKDLEDNTLQEDPAAQAELGAYLSARALPPAAVSAVPANARMANGVYQVRSGKVQPWIEVVPFDEDFWKYFYDPGVNSTVATVEIRLREAWVDVTFNGRSTIRARLDGVYEVMDTPNVLPGLEKTSAVAFYDEAGGLHVDLRWLNGWFRAVMDFLPGEQPGSLVIKTEKNMLHDLLEPIRYEAAAQKIAL